MILKSSDNRTSRAKLNFVFKITEKYSNFTKGIFFLLDSIPAFPLTVIFILSSSFFNSLVNFLLFGTIIKLASLLFISS